MEITTTLLVLYFCSTTVATESGMCMKTTCTNTVSYNKNTNDQFCNENLNVVNKC